MEKTVNAMDVKFNRKNIMKVWQDYTTEDTISVIDKPVKDFKPKE